MQAKRYLLSSCCYQLLVLMAICYCHRQTCRLEDWQHDAGEPNSDAASRFEGMSQRAIKEPEHISPSTEASVPGLRPLPGSTKHAQDNCLDQAMLHHYSYPETAVMLSMWMTLVRVPCACNLPMPKKVSHSMSASVAIRRKSSCTMRCLLGGSLHKSLNAYQQAH